jgi:hypothetical protein
VTTLEMNDENLQELKRRLQHYCDMARRNGYRVHPGVMGKCCCPFGAMLGKGRPTRAQRWPCSDDIEKALGINVADARAFMNGFDEVKWDSLHEDGGYDRRLFELGVEFGRKYAA